MGLGPPSCDICRVTLWLDENNKWTCPLCDRQDEHGYSHLILGYKLDDSNIELRRFLLGKGPWKKIT